MIKFFQKSITGEKSFCECVQNKATHFSRDDGPKKPIGELMANGTTGKTPEPLVMPTMNFVENEKVNTGNQIAERSNNESPLAAPSMF